MKLCSINEELNLLKVSVLKIRFQTALRARAVCLRKKKAQDLTATNRIARLNRAKQLLKKYPEYSSIHLVFRWKNFHRVSTNESPECSCLRGIRNPQEGGACRTSPQDPLKLLAVNDGLCGCVKSGVYWIGVHGAGCESEWPILPRSMFCLLNICFLPSSGFPVDTSHSSRTAPPRASSTRYDWFAVSKDTRLHIAAVMAAQQPWS